MAADPGAGLEWSGYGRPGFPERYDASRPRPPRVLLDLLPELAGVARPRLVVDLGSGTGLSTRFWAEHADEVVGIEPQHAMRRFAESVTHAGNVRYVAASACETGLPDAAADVVTAAQSFHWMDPGRALPEVVRILRPGGVFCCYTYTALQTPLWEPEAAWEALLHRKAELRVELGLPSKTWVPSRERLEEPGVFRRVKELGLHSVERGDGDRLVELALSEGSLQTLLEAGVTEEEVGLDRLRDAARAMPEPVTWWIGYQALVGLR